MFSAERSSNALCSWSSLVSCRRRTEVNTDPLQHCKYDLMEKREDRGVSVKGLKQDWERWSEDHQEYQKHNPFSNEMVTPCHPKLGQKDYGRPPEGSDTERRGKEAHCHIGTEVQELCLIIREIGKRREDGGVEVEFGRLFEHYIPISNKLVGVLLRARKQGLVHFRGEMLWQGRDDGVIIKLLPQHQRRAPN